MREMIECFPQTPIEKLAIFFFASLSLALRLSLSRLLPPHKITSLIHIESKTEEDRSKVDNLSGSPMSARTLEELID